LPLQLYEKEQILDACLNTFARYGYDNTSTAMLAEAAGVSKALLFHHFNSKKELYLTVIEEGFRRGKSAITASDVLEGDDFFATRELFSIRKFRFMQRNPQVYQLMTEAFFDTPADVKEEIEERYGALMAEREQLWRQRFQKVPLRQGVDRDEAFELIMLTLDYFDEKYISRFLAVEQLDDTDLEQFLAERNRFMEMIRHGIEKKGH
jgi:AcrR family transcriptional regulator